MTLQLYLEHRRRYEITLAVVVVAVIISITATSEIIENLRNGMPSGWQGAWAKELSSGISVLILLPLLALFLNWLNLSFSNLRWRIGWHLPAFLIFSLLHTGMFTAMRSLLWASAGETYDFGPVGWVLIYEIRKDLIVYVGVVTVVGGYEFILNRLQGEARFLASSGPTAATSPRPPPTGGASGPRTQFLVKMLNKEYLVRVAEIDWVESASNYVLMHCGERSYPMRFTLTGLAEQLDQAQFMRVHRTAIVNLDRVESIREADELRAELTSGDLVPISKAYLPELKRALAAA